MQDFDILGLKGLFFLYTLLEVLKQNISSFICLTPTIIDLKKISRKLLGSPDLTRAQIIHINELTKVIVVGWDKDLMLITF